LPDFTGLQEGFVDFFSVFKGKYLDFFLISFRNEVKGDHFRIHIHRGVGKVLGKIQNIVGIHGVAFARRLDLSGSLDPEGEGGIGPGSHGVGSRTAG
jgi:hypothetical protein